MNPAELQRTISELESTLDGLGIWLLVATALVVLGLVLEYFHEIPESIRKFKRKWSWGPICIIAGGALITVGVAGEFVVQRMASRIETALRNANHAVFTTLNNEAAQARKRATKQLESVQYALKPLLRKLGIDDAAGLHAFRHGLATELAEASVPITVLQTQMRHADVKNTLRVYAHIIPQSQRDAMERAGMAIGTNVPNGTEVNS